MGRRKLERAPKYGLGLGNVPISEIFLDGMGIHLPVKIGMSDKRLQLRGKNECAIIEKGIVKRLDAEPVARKKQDIAVAIPYGKREHATKALDALFAPFFPPMHDDLRIAMGPEGMAGRDKLLGQFVKVVDFPIENHHHAAIFIEKRLLPAGNIHDGKPPMPKAYAQLRIQFPLVRAAMGLYLVQAAEQLPVDFPFAAGIKQTYNSTHASIPLVSCSCR